MNGLSRHPDWQRLKAEMKQAAPSLGIDDIGVADATRFDELYERLQTHREQGRESGFEESDLDKRVEPSLHLPEAASIIAITVAYPSRLRNAPTSRPGAYRGVLSRSAWGEDYHHVLRNRMERLQKWLEERVDGFQSVSMVDTGPLSDRAVAERAGIGWSGKNCAVISPKHGSWIYLAEMVTNLPLPPDSPVTMDCGDCNRCIDACPTGALVGPGQLDANRCISFVTQTKGSVSDAFKAKIGNRLYGCDTCQIVCPVNKGKDWDHHPETQPDPDTVKPLLLPLLELSNKAFRNRFGHSAAAWRGKNPIQRNAVIALGHFRDTEAVPRLVRMLREDERAYMRETAAWALGRIGTEDATAGLRESLEDEPDRVVVEAVLRALGGSQKDIVSDRA